MVGVIKRTISLLLLLYDIGELKAQTPPNHAYIIHQQERKAPVKVLFKECIRY